MISLQPMGDQALLASFADEAAALHWAAAVRRLAPPWLVDVVGAYTSVAVFFDLGQISSRAVHRALVERAQQAPSEALPGQVHQIPCCYELGEDLEEVARSTGLTRDEVIGLHTATEYVVYAIGFCPGFPYLGYLPPLLCNVPRRRTPRLRVEAGSVGVTGRQTGIYTEPRPGGWSLIGQTPLELVHVVDGYFPLRSGDRVRFVRIGQAEFQQLRGQRLQAPPREPSA